MTSKRNVALAVIVTLLALSLMLNLILGSTLVEIPLVSRCQEDVTLIGQGDFVDGQWSYYVCGPALDDFGGG